MGEDILLKECKVNSGNKPRESKMDNQEIDLHFVKQKLETVQNSILKDVDQKLTNVIEEILQDFRQKELQAHEFNNFVKRSNNNSTWSNRLPQEEQPQTENMENKNNTLLKPKRPLPDKVFVVRESYLTALLEVDHMKSIYNIFFIILTVFLLNSVCYDYFVLGRVNFGLGTIKKGMRDIHLVMGIWTLMHIPVLTVYYALKVWVNFRQKFNKNKSLQSLWSYTFLILFVSLQLSLLYVGTTACIRLNLPYIPGAVMLLETTRLMMKIHGFVRTNAGKILSVKYKTDGETISKEVIMPPFSCYLYYLFAPTLIYRDYYPRTNRIRWMFALNRLLEVVGVAFFYSYIFERHIHVHFSNFGIEELTNASLIVKLFGMIMPGFFIFLAAFYMVLHSWLNFTAELLRFGDRMFYKDWWTARNYEGYFRNWNVVVHDWLYEYIYKDFYNHIFKGSKLASSLAVFFVSAYMHEHIIGVALQMFYPVLFCSFGILGVFLVFLTKDFSPRFGNMFLWFTLITGSSFQISTYSMEYFARQNCPENLTTSWIEWLTPVSWVCNGMK
ncbi:sterol O-acyltransferase 1 [Eupeodes corollae]|uniref:sterol O-acyltransferase 1 n=1 Tax=Eupeodes corollae TaxID=290404 RepID=UPI0024922D0C|nr:sterol O-acyltransferase 1 [Eupeodes corollae]